MSDTLGSDDERTRRTKLESSGRTAGTTWAGTVASGFNSGELTSAQMPHASQEARSCEAMDVGSGSGAQQQQSPHST